jgi:hypothetical protein
MRLLSSTLIVTLLAGALAMGCKRSPEDLEPWRNAKGGVEKLSDWAASPDESIEVRKRAVEILVEDGHAQRLPMVLNRIQDEAVRKQIAAGALPAIEKLWAAQDIPVLTEEMKKGGGEMLVGDSKSARAKDAAYVLHAYVDGEHQKRLEAILAEWVSKDQELRNQLGNATIGQILPRAGGSSAVEKALVWLEETHLPGTVARTLREHADDEIKGKMADILKRRAEEAHPNLSRELEVAVLEVEHANIVPYLQKAIQDPASPPGLIQGAMTSMLRIQGERAAPFLTNTVTEKAGLLRWVAANRLITLRGKAGLLNIALALPLESDTYGSSLQEDITQLCNLFATEMKEQGVTHVSDVLERALTNNRWPAQVIGLSCAATTKSADVKPSVAALKTNRQPIPGWKGDMTIGRLATDVENALAAQ